MAISLPRTLPLLLVLAAPLAQCPAGQFVTGFTSSGALICASPPR